MLKMKLTSKTLLIEFATVVLCFVTLNLFSQTIEPIEPKLIAYNLDKVQFVNDTLGYATSWDYSFFKTNDGGISWSHSYLNNLWTNSIEDMLFINDSTGYVGTFQKVYQTTDYGESWKEIVNVTNVKSLVYILDSILILSNWRDIYRSIDNGCTWIDTTNFPDVVGHLDFYRNNGYALCYNKQIYRTLDAGEQWTLIDTLESGYLTALEVVNDSTVFVAASDRKIYSSVDSGNTWSTYIIDPINSVSDIKFISNDTGFAVTSCQKLGSTIYKTINGGKSWYATIHPVSSYYQGFKSISFPNDSIGYVVGNFGTVLKTTDYGENWINLFDNERQAIYASYQLDSSTLYTGGYGGSIMKSEDQGISWQYKKTDTDLTIRDIVFLTDSIGLAVGGGSYYFSQVTNGFLIKTVDRGENWNLISLPFTEGLFKILHLGGDTIMVTGVQGKVYISYNLGTSWIPQNTNSDYNIIDAYKISNDTIILAGDEYKASGGLILKSTDQGTTWNIKYSDDDSDFQSIAMTSSKKGFVVGHHTGGSQTLILETIDGGETWVEKTFPISTSGLSNITFYGENFGISHSNSAIIITKDGGLSWNNPFLYCEMPENSIGNAILINDTLGYIFTTGGGIHRFISHPTLNYNKSLGVDNVVACDSFTWIDGNIYSSNNTTAMFNMRQGAMSGCDSLVFLNLTINHSDEVIDVISACGPYEWIDGSTYLESNNSATFILSNITGCDSIIRLNLSITNIDTTVAANQNSLTANETDAEYQWLDCSNNQSIIVDEINQAYYPETSGGTFAVRITKNNCIDTSSCHKYEITTNLIENNDHNIEIYPNPTNGSVVLDLGETYEKINICVFQTNGLMIFNKDYFNTQDVQFYLEDEPGVYILEVNIQNKNIDRIKIIKN